MIEKRHSRRERESPDSLEDMSLFLAPPFWECKRLRRAPEGKSTAFQRGPCESRGKKGLLSPTAKAEHFRGPYWICGR